MMNLLSNRVLTRKKVISFALILSALCLSVAYASMEKSVYPSDSREPASTLTKNEKGVTASENTAAEKGADTEKTAPAAAPASEAMWEMRAQRSGD